MWENKQTENSQTRPTEVTSTFMYDNNNNSNNNNNNDKGSVMPHKRDSTHTVFNQKIGPLFQIFL